MKMINSGVTKGTPAKILFGAGVYFSGVTYDEKVAPAESEIKTKLLGATQDGGTLTVTPEFFAPELDGVTVKLEETTSKVGETAQMETSMAELTADLVSKFVIGAVSETTDGKYQVVTSDTLKAGHFYEGFGYYGAFMDGRPLIIIFKKALCTSGLSAGPKNKNNSTFKGTFECYSDIEYGTNKLPYAIFIYKEDEWVKISAEEAAQLSELLQSDDETQSDPLEGQV